MADIPKSFKKVQVKTKSLNARKALTITEVTECPRPGPGQVLVKVNYVGINATDLNSFAGHYGGGDVPFDCGLEAMGTVVEIGEGVTIAQPGAPVAISGLGCYAEYRVVSAEVILPLPALTPEMMTIPISGLTAAAAIGELAEAKEGDVALVTAAAGGTGQFAVQLLKYAYKCTVIGTCSSEDKVEFLKSIGCDRVINYKKEDIGTVLKAEYPKGVDICYESVGGDTFEAVMDNIAIRARVIVIGSITGYKTGTAFQRPESAKMPLQQALLAPSASLRGFMLPNFVPTFGKYLMQLFTMMKEGTVKPKVDETKSFEGIEHVVDAVEHLHSGKSFGKVIVHIQK